MVAITVPVTFTCESCGTTEVVEAGVHPKGHLDLVQPPYWTIFDTPGTKGPVPRAFCDRGRCERAGAAAKKG
jgi:hypothetical protein